MATSVGPSTQTKLSLVSYQTALCVVPPSNLSGDIDQLRSQYDQAYETWPAHINLIYPFVPADLLPVAADLVKERLKNVHAESNIKDISIRLESAGYFPQRTGNTIHLKPAEDQGTQSLHGIRSTILAALGQKDTEERPYNPHLTVGQTKADKISLDSLLDKTNLLPSISWKVEKLLILVRGRNTDPSNRGSGKMQTWGTIDLLDNSLSIEGRRSDSTQIRHVPASLSNIDDFKLCLDDIIPAEEEAEKRKSVFNKVKEVITGESVSGADESNQSYEPKISMVLVPVGSYGLGTWNSDSDIDCLCVGPISSKTFFVLATQRIRKATYSGIRILRRVRAATGTMLELELEGVKLDLQYCPAANITERWQEVTTLPPDDPLFDLSPHALSKLQPFRDQEYIKQIVPDLDILRLAIRFITAWAKRCGIYSSKFGYLGGIHISMMVSSLYKLLYDDFGRITLPELVCAFFHYYANFNWGNILELRPGTHSQYRRLPSESMVILAHHLPTTNVARAIAAPSSEAILTELKRADAMLSEPGMTWAKIMARGTPTANEGAEPASSGAEKFLTEHNSYAKINIQYWGRSPSKCAALVGWLESRFFRLLIDFNRRLPDIQPRIWPARFASKDIIVGVDDTEFQCFYLIGLTRHSDVDFSKEERKKAQQTLQLILDSFTAHIQDSITYYDSTTSWIETTHVKQSELGELKLDNRSLAQYATEELDPDDEDDEDVNDEPLDKELDSSLEAQPLPSRSKFKSNIEPSGVSAPRSQNKLRPAADVLTRLRWDPNIDPSDYIVGYEDRFLGTRETPIDRWKSEQTDEEFIPQHRILYFRRKSDGIKVWDRETRRDELFGSGAGKGE